MIFILVLASASVGWFMGWIVFDQMFYQPKRKQLEDALDGWGRAIDMLRDVKDHLEEMNKTLPKTKK
ncbi:MAG: hypothetical protein WC822_07060 [Candidatus Paceibacterota bacterium]|jgi:hypothetical protein